MILWNSKYTKTYHPLNNEMSSTVLSAIGLPGRSHNITSPERNCHAHQPHCPVCYWVARKVTQHHQLHNLPLYHLPSPTSFLPVLIPPTSLNLKNSSFTRVGEVG